MAYIVVSPPPYMDCHDLYKHLVAKCPKLRKARCVLEYGSKGHHPHLNFVGNEFPTYLELIYIMEKYIKNFRYPCGKIRNITPSMREHLFCIREIYNEDKLDAYLRKEDNAELLCVGEPVVPHLTEYEPIKHAHYPTEIIENLKNYLLEYPAPEAVAILESRSKKNTIDNIVRRVYNNDLSRLYKWFALRADNKSAILDTLLSYFKYR